MAGVDFPIALFWKELSEVYPNAKVGEVESQVKNIVSKYSHTAILYLGVEIFWQVWFK